MNLIIFINYSVRWNTFVVVAVRVRVRVSWIAHLIYLILSLNLKLRVARRPMHFSKQFMISARRPEQKK